MSIPDLDHIKNVILWISYAEDDIGLARHAMKMPGSRPYRLIAYHAQETEKLTPYAVTARYPGIGEVVTEKEALEALDLASIVRKTIRKALQDDGWMIPGGSMQ
ncbi:MAG: hypothetical protein OIN88_14145 [Candidatus Methanoperedens sp.]|nr:hypothetical protein [Candidatus Methanoperedens sp.]MCZ7360063.1 hypothetical protein [Candidatus Methanoperedens sp.]HLB70542.1 hypothetical protein [Candidatus Methanoperedens sp.]